MGSGYDGAIEALRALAPISKDAYAHFGKLADERRDSFAGSLDYTRDDEWRRLHTAQRDAMAAHDQRRKDREAAAYVAAVLSMVEEVNDFPDVRDPDVALMVEKAIAGLEYDSTQIIEDGKGTNKHSWQSRNTKAESDAMREGSALLVRAAKACAEGHPAKNKLFHATLGQIRRTKLEDAKPALAMLRGENDRATIEWRAFNILKREDLHLSSIETGAEHP